MHITQSELTYESWERNKQVHYQCKAASMCSAQFGKLEFSSAVRNSESLCVECLLEIDDSSSYRDLDDVFLQNNI